MKASEKKVGSDVARGTVALEAARGEIETPASGGGAAEEQIRMRAYELYRERGGKVGDDMSDWLKAEREYLEGGPRTTADRAAQPTSSPTPSTTHG